MVTSKLLEKIGFKTKIHILLRLYFHTNIVRIIEESLPPVEGVPGLRSEIAVDGSYTGGTLSLVWSFAGMMPIVDTFIRRDN